MRLPSALGRSDPSPQTAPRGRSFGARGRPRCHFAASDHPGAVEEETLRELNQRKQELEFELRQYGETARKNKSGERAAGLVAPNTRIAIQLAPVQRTRIQAHRPHG